MTALEPLDPAAIMAAHESDRPSRDGEGCTYTMRSHGHHCQIYRLAEALTAERAQVQRVEALAHRIIEAQQRLLVAYRTGGRTPAAAIDALRRDTPKWDELRAALAGDTEGEPSSACDFCGSTDNVRATGRQGMRGCATCRAK